jgi:hypothetical protein
MDKELAQLEEWAVNLINDYEAVLQQKDPKSSQHKRIKRFSGELVANPEAYGELLDMARSKNMTAKDLLKAIRSIESNLLDESSRGTSMSRKQLMSDVIHHFYAQRTGGDTLRKLSQANRQQARAALRELFGPWGNVPENLKSLFRAGHLKSDALKGIEGAAAAELGVTQAKGLTLPKAHTTTGKLVTGDVPGATTWREAVEGMAPQMDIQRTEGLRSIKALQPLMDELDAIAGNKYTGLESAEELAVRRNLFTARSDQVQAAIREFYEPFVVQGGAAKFRAFGVGSAVGFITSEEAMTKLREGDYAGAFQAAGKEMLIGEAVTQGAQRVLPKLGTAGRVVAPIAQAITPAAMAATPLQTITKGTDPNKILAAQERGGKLSFNLGSVKLTLPELGITETLGGMYEAFMSQ